MIASDLATRLRRIGVEVDLAALGDLPPRELDLELCARALEHPHAFTEAELIELRSDHDITALDLGRIVFCPNFGAFGAGPARSYHGRAPRKAWAPQVSTWITYYSDHDASRASVFDAWSRRYMSDAAAVKLRDDAILRMRAEAVSRELARGQALIRMRNVTDADIAAAGLGDPSVCEDSPRLRAWLAANGFEVFRFGNPGDLRTGISRKGCRSLACSPMAHDWIINALAGFVGRPPMTVLAEIVEMAAVKELG
jgi:hypothetical protein